MAKQRDKIIVPGWVRGEMDKMLNGMDGRHSDIVVAQCALLGEEGFDVGHREESHILDPDVYGPAMIEGYKMLAGRALACILDVTRAELENESHPWGAMDDDDKLHLARNAFNNDIREFLEGVATYAGRFTQDEHDADVLTAAASQMIGVFRTIARSKLTFRAQRGEDHD